MKLFSLLTLLCATSVSADYHQCRCTKGGIHNPKATQKACSAYPGARMVGGSDCRLPDRLPQLHKFIMNGRTMVWFHVKIVQGILDTLYSEAEATAVEASATTRISRATQDINMRGCVLSSITG
ncbi:hypothetical protein LZ32DRAFT_652039 [Colletotrichum eremochloae]|nr:hypothetical protein LZ32DRAFT_652039 [Colletotrichum eremochloae]